ncbi:predicted protein, partial [Nematostella vectensis]
MTFKEKVEKLLDAAILERDHLFLIDLKIDEANKINIVLDGDNGVSLQDCVDISRLVEQDLDREENDFSLEVASAGLSSPLKLVRQYKKNIGRKLKAKVVVEAKEEKPEIIAAPKLEVTEKVTPKAEEPKVESSTVEKVEVVKSQPKVEILKKATEVKSVVKTEAKKVEVKKVEEVQEEEVKLKTNYQKLSGTTFTGQKIDLSQFEKAKKKPDDKKEFKKAGQGNQNKKDSDPNKNKRKRITKPAAGGGNNTTSNTGGAKKVFTKDNSRFNK